MTNKKAFTMTELIVVMVIIGIIAAFGIPAFFKAKGKARMRTSVTNLKIIHAAQALYKAKNGNYSTADGLTAINSDLSLNMASDAKKYTCAWDSDLSRYCCRASTGGITADFISCCQWLDYINRCFSWYHIDPNTYCDASRTDITDILSSSVDPTTSYINYNCSDVEDKYPHWQCFRW